MLLFHKRFHEGLVSGAVRLTFRKWDKPHVKAGGRYRCHPIGVLEVEAIARTRVADISAADAGLAGFASRDDLLAYMGDVTPTTEVWRVTLHHGGDGDRTGLALEDRLSAADVEAIAARLERLDGQRPWIRETLAIISKRPRIAASKLAAALGRETLPFKVDVRKLKRLGLTQSFEVGYEISPRGAAYLAAAKRRRPAATAAKRRRPLAKRAAR